MSAINRGADQPSGDERLDRVLALLIEALNLLDEDGNAPEAGARLQGIIDSLESQRKRLRRSQVE